MKLLLFTQVSCVPCRYQKTSLTRLSKEVEFDLEEIDCDDHPEHAKKYKIRACPTLVKMDGDREIERFTGFTGVDKLRAWLGSTI
jgi:thioredoxin-like negative regulator of GroEL